MASPCRGWRVDGCPCGNTTKSSQSYCHEHQWQYGLAWGTTRASYDARLAIRDEQAKQQARAYAQLLEQEQRRQRELIDAEEARTRAETAAAETKEALATALRELNEVQNAKGAAQSACL